MTFHSRLLRAALFCAAFASVTVAQEGRTVLRLEAVTWDPQHHKLLWTVSKGKLAEDGGFQPGKQEIKYEIDMDDAVMKTNGEGRRFSEREAVSVRKLMDLVTKYAAESTVWWEAGEGDPIDADSERTIDRDRKEPDPNSRPAKPAPKSSPKVNGVKVSLTE